jgi:hypothetical protein
VALLYAISAATMVQALSGAAKAVGLRALVHGVQPCMQEPVLCMLIIKAIDPVPLLCLSAFLSTMSPVWLL